MNTSIREHNLRSAAMWGGGGRAYDEISRSISGAIEHCVTRLMPVGGQRILDVATGTGWTSRVIARSGGVVIGMDIAEALLAAAREIAREQGLAIDYQLGDAEASPFQDAAFDAVISTFGVMFAQEQTRAAAELARLCRSGGQLAIAAWTPNSNAVSLRQVLQPFVVPPPAPPPSPFVWGTRDWLTDMLGGDFHLGSENGTVVSRFPSGEATWDAYVNGFGPVRAVAAGLQAGQLQMMQQAFLRWTDQFRTDLGIAIPFEHLVTIGNRR
jgi:SAM-dependent methyltransferase